jgi:zeaxanthin epoxidase
VLFFFLKKSFLFLVCVHSLVPYASQVVEGQFQNFNYAGIVTRLMQPILPVFFTVQFAFLYTGWKNELGVRDTANGAALLGLGTLVLVAFAAVAADAGLLLAFGLESAASVVEAVGGSGAVEFFQSALPSVDGLL